MSCRLESAPCGVHFDTRRRTKAENSASAGGTVFAQVMAMALDTMRASAFFGLTLAFALASGCERDGTDFPTDAPGEGPACTFAEGEKMYEQYLGDVMGDPEAQSCNNCHDPSMRLNVWEKANACATMACMQEKELINLDQPLESRVLEFIEFGRPQEGFDIQVEREYDGFMAWIEYGRSCHYEACGEMVDPCAEVENPTTGSGAGSGGSVGSGSSGSGGSTGTGGNGSGGIYGDCQQTEMQAQFDSLVFPLIDGCKSCHAEPGDPMFDNAKRWYHADDSALTLEDMVGHSGMFNTIQMEKSELITKPLHMGQVYSNVINATFVGEEHEGGQKLSPAGPQFEQRFDSLVTFIQYFASCHQGP